MLHADQLMSSFPLQLQSKSPHSLCERNLHGWLASKAAIACADCLTAHACAATSYQHMHTQLQTIPKAVFYLLKTTNTGKQGAWLAGKQGC